MKKNSKLFIFYFSNFVMKTPFPGCFPTRQHRSNALSVSVRAIYVKLLLAPTQPISHVCTSASTTLEVTDCNSRASGRSIPGYESILDKKCSGLQTDEYAHQMNSGPLNYVSLEHNLSFLFWFWRPRIKDKDRSIRHKISRLTIFEILV